VVSLIWKTRPSLALLLTLVAVAFLSAFINDTPIVVLMIPILVGISLKAKFPVSRVMLPMGLATIIGGMSTTIGTSTNLLVVGVAENLGLPRFGMFDFVLPVAIVGGTGLLYLWLIAPRILPDRVLPMADTKPRIFSSQLFINQNSFAAGKTLSAVLAKTHGEMRVSRIQRGESLFVAKLPSVKLQPGDRLFVRDLPENLKRFELLLGATLFNASDNKHPVDEHTPLKASGQQIAEVVVTRDSPLHLQSLSDMQFSARFHLLPLGIHRARARRLKAI
jgi:di/tricarboxylate transporter